MFQITQEYLKEYFTYNLNTGCFTRKKTSSLRAKKGDMAGYIRPDGYSAIIINRVPYLCHRLAWLWFFGEFPKSCIDHINRNRSDNRWINLRSSSYSQNQHNSPKKPYNTSGLKGASWDKLCKKWRSQIKIKDSKMYLGSFDSKEEAHKKYCEVAKKAHGEFYYE